MNATAPTAKLAAGLLILVCVAVGAVGLILPIIPGILFLAIAALVAANSPLFARWLGRNRALSEYLTRADGFLGLPFRRKVLLGCLLSLKMLIDGADFAVSVAARLRKAARAP
jgi:uncharacterized membrane protein YbaN (DUF454 family)